jgi:hypothetical protein
LTDADGGFAFRVRRGKATFVVQAPGREEVSKTADVPSPNYDLEV